MDKINIDEIFLYGNEDFSQIKVFDDLEKFLNKINIKIYCGHENSNILKLSNSNEYTYKFFTNTELLIEIHCLKPCYERFTYIKIYTSNDSITLISNMTYGVILTQKIESHSNIPYGITISEKEFLRNFNNSLPLYINPIIYCDYLYGVGDKDKIYKILFEKEELKNELENLKNLQINLEINIEKLNFDKNLLKNKLKDIKNKYFYEKQFLNEQIKDLKNLHNNENKFLNDQIDDLKVKHKYEIELLKIQIEDFNNILDNKDQILNILIREQIEDKEKIEDLKVKHNNEIKLLNEQIEDLKVKHNNENKILNILIKEQIENLQVIHNNEIQFLNEQIEDLKKIHNDENQILNLLIEEQIEDLEEIHINEIQLLNEQINNLENKYSYEKNINIIQNKKISSIFELSDDEEIYISNEININKFTYLKLFFY